MTYLSYDFLYHTAPMGGHSGIHECGSPGISGRFCPDCNGRPPCETPKAIRFMPYALPRGTKKAVVRQSK